MRGHAVLRFGKPGAGAKTVELIVKDVAGVGPPERPVPGVPAEKEKKALEG